MKTAHSLMMAGPLRDLGNSWIDMLQNWVTRGLPVVLLTIVVVYALQRFSLKAAIGALLLMVIALGIYLARNTLAGMVQDEVDHPKSAPASVVQPWSDPGVVPALASGSTL
ncbi:hypothetical protein ACICHK_00240 [Streptomyces sp. AHU1]|uniref:hypothetical protein n=1 Tax=Streptomyces sp. AHU1 TaxID=3377215 RepID=UPI003877FD36